MPNRRFFHERLNNELERPHRTDANFAVLLIDLNNFKPVNDQWGHVGGDMLLQEMSARLRQVTRPSDTAARLGGDEFGVLLSPIASSEQAIHLAQQLMINLLKPYVLDGKELDVTASIGGAVRTANCREVVTLLKRADGALYHAKRNGRNCLRFAAVFDGEKELDNQA